MPRQVGHSSLPGLGIFRTTLVQRHSLAATSRFDNDKEIQAAKEAGRCYPLAGYRHWAGEYRKGSLEHDTSSSCFWRRHYPPHYDQGEFHAPP